MEGAILKEIPLWAIYILCVETYFVSICILGKMCWDMEWWLA